MPLFLTLAGFVIGLGAVTVIDLHGFFGRTSPYWTEATIRTHKITKPLIWLGIALVCLGLIWLRAVSTFTIPTLLWYSIPVLIANGLFLTFWVSPRLIQRENEGRAQEILPQSWQTAITISFFISLAGWWGSLFVLTDSLLR